MSTNTSDILAHFDDEHIAHYGVKGMKWGVRKDRRKGSGRTRKGGDSKKKKKTIRERFAEKASEDRKSKAPQKQSEEGQKSRGLNEGSSANPNRTETKKEKPVDVNKPIRRMDTDELRRATERLEAETRFAQAKARNRRTTTTSGKLAGWMGDTTKDIVTDVTKSSFKKLGNELLAEALGIEPASSNKKKKK